MRHIYQRGAPCVPTRISRGNISHVNGITFLHFACTKRSLVGSRGAALGPIRGQAHCSPQAEPSGGHAAPRDDRAHASCPSEGAQVRLERPAAAISAAAAVRPAALGSSPLPCNVDAVGRAVRASEPHGAWGGMVVVTPARGSPFTANWLVLMQTYHGFHILSIRTHGPVADADVVLATRKRLTVCATAPSTGASESLNAAVRDTIDRLLCPCALRDVEHLN